MIEHGQIKNIIVKKHNYSYIVKITLSDKVLLSGVIEKPPVTGYEHVFTIYELLKEQGICNDGYIWYLHDWQSIQCTVVIVDSLKDLAFTKEELA